MLMLASSSSSPRQRGSIERGIDGGNHRVIGGRAGEMCGDARGVVTVSFPSWRMSLRKTPPLAGIAARGRVPDPVALENAYLSGPPRQRFRRLRIPSV